MNEIFELQYALDTFYFLMCGAFGDVDGGRFCHAGSRACSF